MHDKPLDVRLSEAFQAKNDAIARALQIDDEIARLQAQRKEVMNTANESARELTALAKEMTSGLVKRGRPEGWRKAQTESVPVPVSVPVKGKGKK